MIRLARYLLAAMLLAGCSSPDLEVLTFNIRFDNPEDGASAWPARRDWVAEIVRERQPDLVAFQEALSRQVTWLEEALPGYGRLGGGRDDGREAGEFSPIFYRTDRFSVVDHGMWWLSQTPDSVGSIGWDAALPRIATWARLVQDRDTLVFVSTHFDHQGVVARSRSAEWLARKLASEGSPVILAGDFNFTDSTQAHAALVSAGFRDAWPEADRPEPGGTFTGFIDTGEPDGDRIDYVFVRGGYRVRSYEAADESRGGRYPSDHRPVVVGLDRR